MPIRRTEKSREQRRHELRLRSKASKIMKEQKRDSGNILRDVMCDILSDLPNALPLGYLSTLMGYQVDFICERLDATARYKRIWPIMIKVCSTEGYNSTRGKAALEWLASTIPWGARRHNFEMRYIKSGKWHEIPPDPPDLKAATRSHF